MHYEEELFDTYCDDYTSTTIIPIKSMKRGDRIFKSKNKFKQRAKATKWNLTKLEYDKFGINEPCEIPHRGNISALKNNPHTCRTCCNQKWKEKHMGKSETRLHYIRQNDRMNDIEKEINYEIEL